jgi:hypothetical protein
VNREPFVHLETCDGSDCACPGACPFCAGSGEAWDPETHEGPRCPACDGTGHDARDTEDRPS